jgi:hypothetical protein
VLIRTSFVDVLTKIRSRSVGRAPITLWEEKCRRISARMEGSASSDPLVEVVKTLPHSPLSFPHGGKLTARAHLQDRQARACSHGIKGAHPYKFRATSLTRAGELIYGFSWAAVQAQDWYANHHVFAFWL